MIKLYIFEGYLHLIGFFQGKLSEAWSTVTKGAVAEAILALTKIDEASRECSACLQMPTVSKLYLSTFITT